MPYDPALEINERTYQRCARVCDFLFNSLGLNIELHDEKGHLETGQIFLFNHFARFETIVPQYFIHQRTGAYCRCVADKSLFSGDGDFAKFLWSVGAVPTDHPGLLSFLAAEILRGRKVIVFPEGGMIKSREVVGDGGQLEILSPQSETRRKHHKGASAIAVTLELFKKRIISVHRDDQQARLERWRDSLGLDSIEALLAAARKPTLTVPSNITFYPIRITDNLLRQAAEMVGMELGDRAREELLIEGNILLKDTDMAVRFGTPVLPDVGWDWSDDSLLNKIFLDIKHLPDLFALNPDSDQWFEKTVSSEVGDEIEELRDSSMAEMYAQVTVNLSHLASLLILRTVDRGEHELPRDLFHRALYRAIKKLQGNSAVHLHESLKNPEEFQDVLRGSCQNFEQFLVTATTAGLLEVLPDRYRFLPKLQEEFSLHQVRLENPVAVYANEVEPVAAARAAVDEGLESARTGDKQTLGKLLFDDERRMFAWARQAYSQTQHMEINGQATATESGAPFLLLPRDHGNLGVVLVHGFLASPAELKSYGEELAAQGYPVMGVRVSGHGTSPWDLRDRSWEDWLTSVRRGYEIMETYTDNICLVGFSAGGALALRFAAEQPAGLAGTVALCAPLKFVSPAMSVVPLLHGVNRLVGWTAREEGAMPFHDNDSDHPEINYRHMPNRGLYELTRLVDDLEAQLPRVQCPVFLMQATQDPVVDPASGTLLLQKIGAAEKRLQMLPAKRHGILLEDIAQTRAMVSSFIDRLASQLS